MSFKKTMRSIEAASKRAARESAKRERERTKQQQQQQKHLDYLNASDEVSEFNAHVDFLASFHKECSEPFDWDKISSGPEPKDPQQDSRLKPQKEDFDRARAMARKYLDEYEPSLADKLTRRVENKRKRLLADVESSKYQDEREYNDALKQYQEMLNEYQEEKEMYDLSQRIAVLDPKAYLEIGTSYMQADGFSIEFANAVTDKIEVYLFVDDESVIPSEKKTLLKSGKVSVKKMPVTKFWQLYQDYVCSLAIKIAREVFVRMPVEITLITVFTPMLNTQTGHKEEQPVLSAAFSRKTFSRLNFQALDPSDAMSNFVHRMNFASRSGFRLIDPLNLVDFNMSD